MINPDSLDENTLKKFTVFTDTVRSFARVTSYFLTSGANLDYSFSLSVQTAKYNVKDEQK